MPSPMQLLLKSAIKKLKLKLTNISCHNFTLLWHIFLTIISPIQSLNYYTQYCTLLKRLHLHGDSQRFCRIIHQINICILFKSLHFLYLSIAPSLTATERAQHFDAFHLWKDSSSSINAMAVAGCIITIYWNIILLLDPTNISLHLILFRLLSNGQLHYYCQFQLRTIQKLRTAFLVILNCLMLSITTANLFIPFAYAHYIIQLFNAKHTSIPSFIFSLIGYHFSVFGYTIYYYNIFHILALGLTNCSTMLLAFTYSMRGCYRALQRLIIKRRPLDRYYRSFRAPFQQTLLYFFAINAMYGRLFLSALCAILPVHTTMFTWVIQSNRNLHFIVLIIYQLAIIFVLHFALAQCTQTIHRRSTLFCSLLVANLPKCGHLTIKLKLAADIFAIHTTSPYGFTYGPFGLVSMRAFTLYLMLHGKTLMIAYKLMQTKFI